MGSRSKDSDLTINWEIFRTIGRYQTILEIIDDTDPTLKELLGYLAAGGGHLTLIGTIFKLSSKNFVYLFEMRRLPRATG